MIEIILKSKLTWTSTFDFHVPNIVKFSNTVAMEGSRSDKIFNNTFSQNLMRKRNDKNIVTFRSDEGDHSSFFGSISEILCFIALILCVCIIIFGLKYINGDYQTSFMLRLPWTRSQPSSTRKLIRNQGTSSV